MDTSEMRHPGNRNIVLWSHCFLNSKFIIMQSFLSLNSVIIMLQSFKHATQAVSGDVTSSVQMGNYRKSFSSRIYSGYLGIVWSKCSTRAMTFICDLEEGVVIPQQVWCKAGRGGWHTWGLGCHSTRPGQAGKLLNLMRFNKKEQV